jgi:hypothetical protein
MWISVKIVDDTGTKILLETPDMNFALFGYYIGIS